jgi:hypothetical protein
MTSISTYDHQYKNNYVRKTLIITDQFLNYNNGTDVSNVDIIVIVN